MEKNKNLPVSGETAETEEQKVLEETLMVQEEEVLEDAQKEKEKESIPSGIKKKLQIASIAAVIILIGACAFTYQIAFQNGRDTEFEAKALASATEIKLDQDEEYKNTMESLKKTETNLKKVKDELTDNQSILKELEEYKKNKASCQKEIEGLNGKVESLKADVSNLDTQIAEKTAELNRVKGDIIIAQGEPFTLPAGDFTVGHDINPGRYLVSGTSNFIVDSSSGRLKVNTILGYDSFGFGDGDYVCTLEKGDQVQNHAKTTFQPIKK